MWWAEIEKERLNGREKEDRERERMKIRMINEEIECKKGRTIEKRTNETEIESEKYWKKEKKRLFVSDSMKLRVSMS